MTEGSEELPKFEFNNDVVIISGKSIPFDAKKVWSAFAGLLEIHIQNVGELTINFKMDYFNTSSSMYLTEIFKILNANYYKKKIVVNWFYDERDFSMEDLGEFHQERAKFEFNMVKKTIKK